MKKLQRLFLRHSFSLEELIWHYFLELVPIFHLFIILVFGKMEPGKL